MNLVCKIGVATAAIAATLTSACNFFDAEDAANTTPSPTRIEQATTAIYATSHISDVPSPTLHLEPDRRPSQPPLSSTPTGPTPLTEADQTLTEDQRWCQAWALDNFYPHAYLEFAKLDPANAEWHRPDARLVQPSRWLDPGSNAGDAAIRVTALPNQFLPGCGSART